MYINVYISYRNPRNTRIFPRFTKAVITFVHVYKDVQSCFNISVYLFIPSYALGGMCFMIVFFFFFFLFCFVLNIFYLIQFTLYIHIQFFNVQDLKVSLKLI